MFIAQIRTENTWRLWEKKKKAPETLSAKGTRLGYYGI